MKRWMQLCALGCVGGALMGVTALASCSDTEEGPIVDGSRRDTSSLTYDAQVIDSARPQRDASSRYDGAYVDAGFPPLPGDWAYIPATPEKCGVVVSKTPELAIEPFKWKACASGRAGCLSFLGDWKQRTDQYFDTSHFAKPYEDGSGVHLAYVRAEYNDDGTGWRYGVVQLLHGNAELVVAGPHGSLSCSAAKIHASPDGYGVFLRNSNATTPQLWALTSPPSAPADFSIFSLNDRLEGSRAVQGLARDKGMLVLERTSGGPIFAGAIDLSDRKAVTTDSPARVSELPVPVAGGYFTVVLGSPNTLAFVPLAGGYRTVVSPLGGRFVTWVTVDHKNNDALVWYESDINTGDTIVYTSPLATTAAGIVRRAVARLPQFSHGVANGGVYAVPKSYGETRVIRLSDGLAWDIPGEADPTLLTIWVNDEFVWMGISSNGVGEPGFPSYAGIVRLPRPTTAPTVPSGL